MKTSKEIVGLPIISISDGKELGTVKSLVVNPEFGTIDFITVHHEDYQISVKAVPFKKVIGVGSYAVTVESEMNIIDLTEIPIANTLVTKNIKVNGARIMTKKGQLIGKVVEYFINEDNGSIIGLQLDHNNDDVVLASEHVHTYGKDILIVNEEAEQYFLSRPEELINGKDELVEEEATEDIALKEAASTTPVIEEKTDEDVEDLSQAFLDRQIALLEGKKVTTDIYNKNGDLLIEKDTELSKEMILAVHNDGPSGMVELSMSVEMD